MNTPNRPTPFRFLSGCGLALLLAATPPAHAANTDIASAPLVTSSSTAVLPNLMFVLDDSGSMDWDFLPDWANDGYCKKASDTSSFTGYCCRDNSSTDGNGRGSTSCWTGSASFGAWRGHPPFLNADFNMVYYNPAITYSPPKDADGTPRNSMTAANSSNWAAVKNDAYNIQNTGSINLTTQFPDTEWCTSNAYTDCLRNDNYILPGTVSGKNYTVFRYTVAAGSGQAATGSYASPTVSASRSWGPHYYAIIPGEYCDALNLRNCVTAAAPSGTNIYPAKVRWCSDTARTNCQAIKTGTYKYIRYPGVAIGGSAGTSATAIIQLGGNAGTSRSVTSIKVNGLEIMSGSSSSSSNADTLGSSIDGKIDACTSSATGNCQVSGYKASYNSSNNRLTVTAPAALGAITFTPVVTISGSGGVTFTPSAFTGGVNPVAASYVPGSFQRIDIVPGTTSYVLPGTAAKAGTRTDCAGATCTYNEEMTNFANWWTYYHSRMQMMKTAASHAFQPIDERYRVGFFTINTSNTSTGTNFLNIGTFDTTQKSSWFTKLFASDPSGSTPLRAALSKAGRIYAGKVGSDPMQYACQQNFTILSSDGYWNSSAGYKEDGSSPVGNQDGSAVNTTQLALKDGSNVSDTLADVAMYYYMTDLRPAGAMGALGTDVSDNIVPVNNIDTASWQHMTTFTLGLGIDGYMQFSPTYMSDTSGDYFAVRNGSSAGSGICTWQASGSCTWPSPSSDSQANIDDLWHAAVNGRGTYFAATNPTTLATGLSDALAGVSKRLGAGAAATTSTTNPVQGDNFVFNSEFTSVEWAGELVRQQLDLATGKVLDAEDWSAQALLDGRASAAADTRVIYTFDPGSASKLKPFTWGDLTASEQAHFGSANVASLSQGLTGADLTSASGENLVKFLRGQRGNEGTLYRIRTHILGDIVSSEAVYVKAPTFSYADSGYDAFKSANASRQGMVYVGANDGMLHAFNADSGLEEWAYVPSLVLPGLYKLADSNYGTLHRFFVDGTPTVGDAYIGGAWKTILVGGLNAGGRGFYALDVTSPSSPKVLWEFTYDTLAGAGYTTDANLGYSFGNPVITKLKNGTWVVLLTSGYNNTGPGDGMGYLYVLNAATGAIIRTISTNTGSTAAIGGICAAAPCPSGLARINAWADAPNTDNTATRAYGGDLFGNLWRFDINGDVGAAGYDAQQIAYFRNGSGGIQPVTIKPELGECGTKAAIMAGTGRLLGPSDMSDASQQTVYAVKDDLGSTSIGNAHSAGAGLVQQTLTQFTDNKGRIARKSSSSAVDFSSDNGWYIDLPESGERANTDFVLTFNTLTLTTNVPNSSACTVGGDSWIMYFDACSGKAVDSSPEGSVGLRISGALSMRPQILVLPNNTVIGLVRTSKGETHTFDIPVDDDKDGPRRVSWRELIDDQ